ncbi:MAG: LytTR family transcriptional regulator [Clostridia bacterium]|nr:LytTR family transcriptional regulator [Clostridia bacterium]
MKVRLITTDKNRNSIVDILSANSIDLDDESNILLAERGCIDTRGCDLKIEFSEEGIDELINILSLIGNETKLKGMILGKFNETYKPIKIADISYFNALNNDTYANLADGKSYLVKKKLYQLEDELIGDGFFRINKSELVNMKKISLITPMFKGKLIINLEGYKAPFDISRSFTKAFKERLGF